MSIKPIEQGCIRKNLSECAKLNIAFKLKSFVDQWNIFEFQTSNYTQSLRNLEGFQSILDIFIQVCISMFYLQKVNHKEF